MSSRVPPSTKPPQSQQPQGARRSTRPQAAVDKPKPIKTSGPQAGDEPLNSPEAALWAGQDMDRSLEIRAVDVEQRMGELVQSEELDKKEGAEHAGDLREKVEKEDKKGLFKIFSWQKAAQGPKADPKALLLAKQKEAHAEALKKLPAFKKPGATSSSAPNLNPVGQSPTAVSTSRLQAVQRAMLSGQSATNERPPDAFALLKEAREKGILFVEDALQDGHSEDQEDPEHAAAVEECIAQCFGVRGILRIGPGHNDKAEPIIVVATTHGFSEASLGRVPEKVHRFPTLIAIPFDLLPLKRER